MSAGLLHDLTRPELDELIRQLQRAETLAHIALVNAPLDLVTPYRAAGLEVEVAGVLFEAYAESLDRFCDGEVPA